jgi:hypothetical protein
MNGAVRVTRHHREHARAERVDGTILRRPAGDARRRELSEFEHAGQVEREHEEQHRERGDDLRRLQLEAPAKLLAAGAQRRQQEPQRNEGRDDAACERDCLMAQRGFGVMVRRESQHLERKNREDAGHQVEDHSAHERGNDRDCEREEPGTRSRRWGRQI